MNLNVKQKIGSRSSVKHLISWRHRQVPHGCWFKKNKFRGKAQIGSGGMSSSIQLSVVSSNFVVKLFILTNAVYSLNSTVRLIVKVVSHLIISAQSF